MTLLMRDKENMEKGREETKLKLQSVESHRKKW